MGQKKIEINRQKLGLEDLELGSGTVTQTRGGVEVEVTQINVNLLPVGSEGETFGDYVVRAENAATSAEEYSDTIIALEPKMNATIALEPKMNATITLEPKMDATIALEENINIIGPILAIPGIVDDIQNAEENASIATEKAGEAVVSAQQALDYRNKAEKWADETVDVEVEPGKYSAKHWAQKADDKVNVINDTVVGNSTTYSSEKIESDKQDTLVNQVNIKSINNEAILGEGNLNLSVGGGGYAANVYLTDTVSTTNPSYKQISYSLPSEETTLSVVTNDNEVLLENFIFDGDIKTQLVPSGEWSFTYYGSVDNTAQTTTIRFEVFSRTSLGVETVLFSSVSQDINDTGITRRVLVSLQDSFSVNETDRIGIKVYASTSRTSDTTVSLVVGDGRGSHFTTPVEIRHNQLRARSEVDAHPIGSITGLSESLDGKAKLESGFYTQSDSALSFDDVTRTLTIQPTGTEFKYTINQKIVTVTEAKSVVIPDLEGEHFVYFNNETATLVSTQVFNPEIMYSFTYVASLYWDASNKKLIVLGEERHGNIMDSITHSHLHLSLGTQYISGLAVTNTSGSNIASEAGVIRDEDIQELISNQTTFYKLWREGANASWRKSTTADSLPYTLGVDGRVNYNLFSGGVWSLEQAPNTNYFCNILLFAVNDVRNGHQVVCILDDTIHNTLNEALDSVNSELNTLITGGLNFQEFVPIAVVTVNTNGNIQELTDLRQSKGSIPNSFPNHETLNGLLGGTTGEHYHLTAAEHLQVQELNSSLGAKQNTLVSGVNIKTLNNQSILGSGNIEVGSSLGSPEVSISLTVSERYLVVGTITNFNPLLQYYIVAERGLINGNSGLQLITSSTFTYRAPSTVAPVDDTDVITIYYKLESNTSISNILTVTVVNVPDVSDTVITFNFGTDTENNFCWE